jgi:hypothetical protein
MNRKKIVGAVTEYRGPSLDRVQRGTPTTGTSAQTESGGPDERA